VKARTVGARASIPAVVAIEVVALATFALLTPRHFGWWPAAAIAVAVALVLVLTVHRRSAVGWLAAARRWRRARRGVPALAAAAIDVPHGDSLCGVRVDEHEAITMINVTGLPYTPTFLRGAAVVPSPNVVPLGLLTGLLEQPGGLRLRSIDIVSSGLRVRRGSGYPPLYGTLLADRPAAGQRSTRLVLRLDITTSVRGLQYRHSIGAAVAAATERIVNALAEQGIRAEALSAHQLDIALVELGAGLAEAPERVDAEVASKRMTPAMAGVISPLDFSASDFTVSRRRSGGSRHRATLNAASPYGSASVRRGASARSRRPGPPVDVGWRRVNTHPGHLTTYYFSPEDITTAALHQMWALRTDEVVQTTTIGKDRATGKHGGPMLVSATVRCNDPQPPPQPPTLYLNTLPGDQYAATLYPAPAVRPPLKLPSRRLGDPAALAIPIGPTGILVGTAMTDDPGLGAVREDWVMLALTDPQRATRIVMETSDFYARQLLIRAAAVGERIAIYSDTPQKWASLSQPYIALVHRSQPPEFVPSIIVSDRPGTPPAAGLASTVITIRHGETGSTAADLEFLQASNSTVRITAPTFSIDVEIAAFRQEQAWTG
jgi:type VII secretion protein EccE